MPLMNFASAEAFVAEGAKIVFGVIPTGVDIDVSPAALAVLWSAKVQHPCLCLDEQKTWMPTFAGMTGWMAICQRRQNLRLAPEDRNRTPP